jgi:hypothetical protein
MREVGGARMRDCCRAAIRHREIQSLTKNSTPPPPRRFTTGHFDEMAPVPVQQWLQ